MNTDTFNEIADLIEWTDRFDLNTYAALNGEWDGNLEIDENGAEIVWESCDTTACVAGWVNVWSDHKYLADEKHAAKELGIDREGARSLFYAGATSVWARLADEYGWKRAEWGGLADWGQITAPQAATVLRRIAAGEVTL